MGDAETTAVFVEGGMYHVYNRVTRAERVFAEDHEAARLLDAIIASSPPEETQKLAKNV